MLDITQQWAAGVSPPPREIFLAIETPRHRCARLLYDEWRKRETAFVIGRDIPSRPLAPVLRNVAVLEPTPDRSDYHVRLAGTAWMRRFGADVTGAMLSGLYDEEGFAFRRELLSELLETGAPLLRDVKLMDAGGVYLHYELVGLRAIRADRRGPCALTGLFPHDWIL